ncbi:M13 family metallopeptidase [Ligilactobacillus acidipiscis]|uniref:Neutral endopeptidase O n=1 Tax=Ligilactobacillus acidipiscis TaxID=89059 RepID=A0A1K1KRR0_9LACO|nr:M13-type metalloendopeptidase [Ligilactobacillus acidipiscis]SFV41583.1 Neutral endopeptidase O [Ligilactobacillus acidipiscis]
MSDTINTDLLKDDLYQAVNGEWLKTAKIPADKPTTGGFADLADNIEETLMSDFDKFLDGSKTTDDKYLQEFIKYYRIVADFDKRDAQGFTPIKKSLDKIDQLKDLKDWQDSLYELTMDGNAAPVSLYVAPDMKDTQHYALNAEVPSLILPDKTYYEEGNEQAEALLQVYSQMVLKLFKLAGYSDKFARKTLAGALKFDRSLAPHEKDSTERADYAKDYNKYSFEDFVKLSSNIDLTSYATQLIKTTPDQVIVSEPKFYEALDDLVSDDTFTDMKSWIFVKRLVGASSLLSDEARIIGGEYGRALSGSKEPKSKKKSAYYFATGQFDQVVGLYYAHKYFGETAKNDVHKMVEKMVAVYQKRLSENDWLSEDTKKKAVTKLNTLGIQVGYPDELDPLYKKFTVNEDENLYDNDARFTHIILEDHFSRWGKEVNRTRWEMPAHMVNAYYNPSFNVIVFPAAILQAPFYSLEQSSSENYGGIGAVIAHEISHAFDNNGAQFDELGNLHNWWTADDMKYFKALAQDEIDQFDGLETKAGKVKGKLVVSENIADAGGLSCALEAAKAEDSADIKAFFINWGRIWRMKSSLEREKLLLSIDVHSPNELRANVQPKNLIDFYAAFDIQPGDGMYLPEEQRVNIW